MARLAGPTGSVTAVDLQEKMLVGVRRRAEKYRVAGGIRYHQSDESGLHLPGAFDVALAFWMIHEVPDQGVILAEIFGALKVGGLFLLSEPRVHVSAASFIRTVVLAGECGFSRASTPQISFSRSVILTKAGGRPAGLATPGGMP
jgi:ubiquinone/menaquinone biosynthesis C-methylase UbiE